MTEIAQVQVGSAKPEPLWAEFIRKDDWWAIWIGLGLVVVAAGLVASGGSLKWLAIAPQKWHAWPEAVAQLRAHACRGLLETDQTEAAMVALRRERVAQHAVDALPGGQYLRAGDSGGGAAVAIEDFARGHGNAEIACIEPERVEPRDQFGLRDDAGAAAGKLAADPLENIDVPAAPIKHDAGQKPAHRAADDQRAAVFRHESRFSLSLFPKPQRFSIL